MPAAPRRASDGRVRPRSLRCPAAASPRSCRSRPRRARAASRTACAPRPPHRRAASAARRARRVRAPRASRLGRCFDQHEARARRVVRRRHARRAHRAAAARDDGRAERVPELRRRDRAGAQHRRNARPSDRRSSTRRRRVRPAVDDQVDVVAQIGAHVRRASSARRGRSGSPTAPRRAPPNARRIAARERVIGRRAPRRCPVRPLPSRGVRRSRSDDRVSGPGQKRAASARSARRGSSATYPSSASASSSVHDQRMIRAGGP